MSCYDCNRTELLRKAVAEAGRGLPAIEPGMPLPAGTGMPRRSFLLGAGGLAIAVFGGSRLLSPQAVDAALEAAPAKPILLSVFMSGGADTLSVLFPAGDPLYRQFRPDARHRRPTGATAFAEDARLYWHPAAAPLATLCMPKARSRCSRRSATTIPTSRISPRGTTGRSARPTRICAPVGSAAISIPWDPGQPAAGTLARHRLAAVARHYIRARRRSREPRPLPLLRSQGRVFPPRDTNAEGGGRPRLCARDWARRSAPTSRPRCAAGTASA